jgi:hypothetical protein
MVRKPDSAQLHTLSKFGGGALLVVGICLFAWLIFFQHPATSVPSQLWFTANVTATPVSGLVLQNSALQAAGIQLESTNQPAVVSQAQALQLVNQQQPDAAADAKKIEEHYGLLNENAQKIHNVAVWMIWYQSIAQPPNGIEVSATAAHDLYVFVDAKTGRTILSVWA